MMTLLWRTRIAIAWSAVWAAFSIGCAERGDGNVTLHMILAALQVAMLVVNVGLFYHQKRESED